MTNPRNTPSGESGTTLLSTARLDALREVANIGAGHAATALSTLTGTRIMISVPMVNVVPPGDFIPEIAPGVEVVAVQMAMSGDISGQTVFVLAVTAGLRLAERMLRRKRGTSPNLGKLEQSALNEAGNILAGAYLTALSDFLDMRLMLSPPALSDRQDRRSPEHPRRPRPAGRVADPVRGDRVLSRGAGGKSARILSAGARSPRFRRHLPRGARRVAHDPSGHCPRSGSRKRR